MARPIDIETSYRVKIHKNGEYMYASTQPIILDPACTSVTIALYRYHA